MLNTNRDDEIRSITIEIKKVEYMVHEDLKLESTYPTYYEFVRKCQ